MMNNDIGSTSSSSSFQHLHTNNSFQFQHHPYSSSSPPKPSLFTKIPSPQKKLTRYIYKECLKNHAATMGMTATDGCGEFMPGSSPESTLICSACGCHRNFHRQETVYPTQNPCAHGATNNSSNAAEIINNEANNNNRNYSNLGQVMNLGPEPDHMVRAQPKNTHDQSVGKRWRTKLSREQKERMADKIGWRLQKQDVELLQELCQEIGVRTSVFKVWMHNKKHMMMTTRVGHRDRDRKNVHIN